MLTLNKDYINQEVSVGGNINKSGCYEVLITDAHFWDSNNSEAKSLNLKFEDTESSRKAWLNLFFKGKDGSQIDFQMRNLNHLMFLTKNKGLSGDKNNKIQSLQDKIVGIILKVDKETIGNDGRQGYKYDLIGFYDPSTKQTAKEKSNKEDAEVYNTYLKRFEDAEEIILSSNRQSNGSNEQSNLWEGFETINNDDIPF